MAASRPAPRGRRFARVVTALVLLAIAGATNPASAANAVTEWTLEADRLGGGGANWRTLAIMHMAMHDAAQAVEPRYGRWTPGPAAARGAVLEAALAGAAAKVLVELHPDSQAEIGVVYQAALARLPAGQGVHDGIALGMAAGLAAVRHRDDDGYDHVYPFRASGSAGRWRPTPPRYQVGATSGSAPFLMPARDWPGERPPPAVGSAIARRDAAELRVLGGVRSAARTQEQAEAAEYWAYQSSQRGFMLLAVRFLDGSDADLPTQARLMSLMAAGMADAAILTWAEKERYASWRPITAIRSGADGRAADPDWSPLIETPPHPEYPSGHAADCFTGAGLLAALFDARGPVSYVAQSALSGTDAATMGMGQHAQSGGPQLHARERRFGSVEAAAAECAESRIWAGAHFRSANEESHRIADVLVARAKAALAPLSGQPKS